MIWVLVALPVLAWCTVVVAMALLQRRFLYLPGAICRDPKTADAAWMTAVETPGGALLGWWAPPDTPHHPTLLIFHGNRGTLARIAAKAAPWKEQLGIGVFAATYRGYEGNPGAPTEARLYQDGRDALAWLDSQGIARDKLVIYGESLGSGVAAELALSEPMAALVLEAPFTSIADMAAARYPLLPARRLVQDRFDTIGKIGRITVPTLILHGDEDRTTDIGHSQKLKEKARTNVQLIQIKTAGHLDIHTKGGTPALLQFIKTACRSKDWT